MKITFITNFVNHHQIPLAEEFFSMIGDGYHLIATAPMEIMRRQLGYPEYNNKPYVINAFESANEKDKAIQIISHADVVVIGDAPEEYVTQRILRGCLTFRYHERWFKNKPWYLTGIRGWKNIYQNHLRYINKPLYMLAASAYTANDVYKIGAYKNKVFKWGYFTEVRENVVEKTLDVSMKKSITILWCARFLSWKHPELPIQLAKKLKDDEYDFHLDMIGIGEELEKMKELAKQLDLCDVISFLGSMPNNEVLSQMRSHEIFLFTSDKREGWGAVLNEAMSSGCAVVTSDKIGSTPFLINDGKNGLIFRSENLESLYIKTKYLLDNPGQRRNISNYALFTMKNIWSPRKAAERLISLSEALLQVKATPFIDGPCSQALPIRHF